ncbi:MAG: hypothetical protein QXS54_03320 [Candidatus Methanomethylicaceae archaeon]
MVPPVIGELNLLWMLSVIKHFNHLSRFVKGGRACFQRSSEEVAGKDSGGRRDRAIAFLLQRPMALRLASSRSAA